MFALSSDRDRSIILRKSVDRNEWKLSQKSKAAVAAFDQIGVEQTPLRERRWSAAAVVAGAVEPEAPVVAGIVGAIAAIVIAIVVVVVFAA